MLNVTRNYPAFPPLTRAVAARYLTQAKPALLAVQGDQYYLLAVAAV
jgi:hypothetical protein